MDLRPIGGLALVLLALGQGIAIRSGSSRAFERIYRDVENPALLRNLGFALIPVGVTLAIGLVAGLSVSVSAPRAVSAALFVLFLVGFLMALGVALRPPDVAKPAWLVEEERTQRPGRPRLHGFDLLIACMLGGGGTVGVILIALLFIR